MLTSHCAVVGDPVLHSLSPALYRAGYREAGLEWQYDAVRVRPGRLGEFVASLSPQWRGLSVTMPHKKDAAALGRPDELVELLGVANTLILGDEPRVYNTDVAGFSWALSQAGITTCPSAVILGNGATAASLLAALARLGLREAYVAVRKVGRSASLRELAEKLGVALTECLAYEKLPQASLLASTIPSHAVPSAAAECAPAVFDVIYDPWPTPLATQALRLNRRAISGLDLLIGQALDQFELMTGHRVSAEVFQAACRAELARRLQP